MSILQRVCVTVTEDDHVLHVDGNELIAPFVQLGIGELEIHATSAAAARKLLGTIARLHTDMLEHERINGAVRA